MRRLMLLRHAKSDRTPGVDDHERPLNPRGRAAAPMVGAYLDSHGQIPDLIVCSTAKRTRETCTLLAAKLRKTPRIVFDEALYLAEPEEIIALAQALPRDVRSAMLIGHNPGLHDAAIALAGSGDAAARRELREKFPTTAVAVIDFPDGGWGSIDAGRGTLERFVTPKSIDETD